MSPYYKLDENKNPVPCVFDEWEKNIRHPQYKRVAETTIDGKWVSTVFLSIDHGFGLTGSPILFETMVFENKDTRGDIYQRRYCTHEEAMKGHTEAVKWVLDGCKDEDCISE